VIAVDHHDGVAVVRFEHGKVNVLDLELLQALAETLGELHDADAIVLTGAGRAFSAGVDLKRLLDGGPDDMEEFLVALDAGLLALYDYPRPAVAAVNGHAIAGGCILVQACDYRVMSGGTIGVAELRVGVPFPTVPFEILRNAVGPRIAGLILTGRSVGPEEALALGLVDETEAPEHLLGRALDRARMLARIPASTFAHTREQLRGDTRRRIEAGREADRATRALWQSDEVRNAVRGYLAELAAR
jgi:enoyl-CoA hydratase